MEKYRALIYNNSLYTTDFIENFGTTQPGWNLLSYRGRELSLCRSMCLVLLSNNEMLQKYDMMDKNKEEDRKRKPESMSPKPGPSKMPRESENEGNKEETILSSDSAKESSSSDSKSSSTEMDVVLDLEDKEEIARTYRFELIAGMPNAPTIQNYYASMWQVNPPRYSWDIVDKMEKKFINVRVYQDDIEEVLTDFEERKEGNDTLFGLIAVNINSLKVSKLNIEYPARGEPKMLTFLKRREIIRGQLDLLDSDLQDSGNIVETIMCSKRFNSLSGEWLEDILSCEYKVPEEEIKTNIGAPMEIFPSDFLKNLSKLDEKERENPILWKGKIIPEGFAMNTSVTCSRDEDMIKAFSFSNLSYDSIQNRTIIRLNIDISEKNDPLIEIIKNIKENPEWTCFGFFKPNKDERWKNVENLLGIGMKKRKHDEFSDETFKQKEYRELKPLKYDSWFDEVIRRFNKVGLEDKITFKNLLETPPNLDHPIAKITEPLVTHIIGDMLTSNTAIYSSKMVNLYSRLGGAYHQGKIESNRERCNVSIFPIYATTYHKEDIERESSRLVSGFCLRGPHHAKSQTDRINILTLEIMENNEENIYMSEHIKCIRYITSDNKIVILRPNSIMKEDTSYCTFNINSIFSPVNSFGCATLEKLDIKQNHNMIEFAENFYQSNKKWFLERFTEGVLFSAIGNARDEGYFAYLRKIFLVVLAWRRNEKAHSWDIKEFCEKTNENLLDNPLSMYFHRELLLVIAIHNNRKIEGPR